MFGKSGGSKPPQYVAPPPYREAPDFQMSDPQNGAFNQFVPGVESASSVVGNALGIKNIKGGDNSAEAKLLRYAPWLSLQGAPTESYAMQKAMDYYRKTIAAPQFAQNESNLFANDQLNGSYAGAYLGQENAMDNLNSFQAGLAQQNQEFEQKLAGRNALYTQPIGLEANQNMNNVNRALGVSALDLQQNLGKNSYNLSNNQGYNTYNLGANENRNNFNSSNYGIQSQAQTSRQNGTLGFIGGLANTIVGNKGLF